MNKILIICLMLISSLVMPKMAGATNIDILPGAPIHIGNLAPVYVASGNCSSKANSLAASYGNAQILSVEQNGNSCVIVIRVKGKNGNPPRILTKTVSN